MTCLVRPDYGINIYNQCYIHILYDLILKLMCMICL